VWSVGWLGVRVRVSVSLGVVLLARGLVVVDGWVVGDDEGERVRGRRWRGSEIE
jgi:hypothetical protein